MRSQFIDPGAFRTELLLQEAVLTPDGMGGHTEAWTEKASVMARITPATAMTRFGAGQTLEATTHSVALRHRADVKSGMRFVHGGRVLEILTAHDPDESGRYLVCSVRETGR